MKHLFSTSSTVLAELMQNSRRAGATQVEFAIDEAARTIRVSDDGCGVGDFNNLLQLCESGWDEAVTLTDSPFGMGFFSVFFACDYVVVRSRGKVLQASLDDIQSKRALQVRVDKEPVHVGAVIEMHGVTEKLFVRHPWSPFDVSHHEAASEAVHRVRYSASGFPLAVFLNGVELARPYALDNLQTTRTQVGHIHLRAMHDDAYSLPDVRSLRDVKLFLQGLPIGEHKSGSNGCVHLDSMAFTARVPDRTELYDHATQAAKILRAIRDLASQYLVTMKDVLDAEPFVRRFFSNCREYGALHLLNDVPFLPLSLFQRVSRVDYDSEDVWELCMRYRVTDSEAPLVSRQQFVSGELRAWRDAPFSTEDDGCDAPAILKAMQMGDILSLDGRLDEGHWIYKLTPSCDDLQVHVRPVNPGRRGIYTWNAECEVVVTEAVEVEVTSRVDEKFRFTHTTTDDWFMVSKVGPAGDSSGSGRHSVHERPMLCYVTALCRSNGHPVRVFSDYKSENETLREDWETDACDYWDSLVAGLLGSSLAHVLNQSTLDVVVAFSQEHEQQLALASVAGDGRRGAVVFDDLGESALWARMAAVLGATPVTAEALQRAFFEARKLEALTVQEAKAV
ncbi:MAG: ATP-binding protein [Burkholderiaceae bacterium]|nr:ATP-binding protein [Burkholderiaceae bacterium]